MHEQSPFVFPEKFSILRLVDTAIQEVQSLEIGPMQYSHLILNIK